MLVSTDLSNFSKLALVACDASYFTSINPVAHGSALGPLNEGDPSVLLRFEIPAGFFETNQFIDPPGVQTGFKAIAYEKIIVGSSREVIIAFGGCDGGLFTSPNDWIASTQHLGWNQWDENRNQIFQYLNNLPADTKITFTGQSLGGALAQYAAYEWVKAQQEIADTRNTTFDTSKIGLITFNSLGGYLGLKTNLNYDQSVLANLDSNRTAHFVITGDIASRLGGDPSAGIGHVGGQMYLLDYRTVNPATGELVKLDLVEGHRVETGFYAGLHALNAFTIASPLFRSETPQQWYLPMTSLQNTASLLANIFNGRDVGRVDSYPRLLAGLMAGMTFGNQQEWDALIKAYLTNQHEAGKMSDTKYAFYSAATLPASVAGKPVTTVIYAASVILAGLAESIGLGLTAIQVGLATLKSYLQVQTGPDEPMSMSQGEFSEKAALVLAATGAMSETNALRREFLAHGFSPDALAQELLSVSGDTWRTDTLAYLRDQLQNPSNKVQVNGIATAFYETLGSMPGLPPSDRILFAQERDAFIRDTGSGFANAIRDFTQKIANVAFDLGQIIINFADIRFIDQAYAAELSDPRLSSSVRTAVQDARDIFRHAAQAVVVQQGIGANPFDAPEFDPALTPLATGSVSENAANVFTAYLPFAAGVGGQAIQLKLNNIGSTTVLIMAGSQELIPQNGTVTLHLPEGQRQVVFSLKAPNVEADTSLTVNAVLVDASGEATHVERQEATVALVSTDLTVSYENGLPTHLTDVRTATESFDIGPIGGAGSAFNELVWVGSGDDSVFAHPASLGNHQFHGGAGHDALEGALGHDRLSGEAGKDWLRGDAGDDVLDGGADQDILLGQAGDDTLNSGDGDDFLQGGSGRDTLVGGDGNDTLLSSALDAFEAEADVLRGGAGADFLWGGQGDDVLEGGGEADVLRGDNLVGSYTNLVWQAGVDPHGVFTVVTPDMQYRPEGGADYLDGGPGDDTLYGEGGNDILFGSDGNDALYGDDEFVSGGVVEGDDFLDGGDGNDFLKGGGGKDVVAGGDGTDLLIGDYVGHPTLGADDALAGGAGDDELQGGGGHDLLDGGTGNDRLFGDAGDDELFGGVGVDELQGGEGDDVLVGGTENDRLVGQAGHDELDGGSGNDVLAGDAGQDRLFGGEGNDVLHGGSGANLLVGELGDDVLVGGTDADLLFGDDGNDDLQGGDGADELTGGLGVDRLDGGAGEDTYVFNLGDGMDTIVDTPGEGNKLVFGAGISERDLTLGIGSLVVRVGGNGDTIDIEGFNPSIPTESGGIDLFEFADGSTLTHAELVARGFELFGTMGDDFLDGGEFYQRISGLAGQDVLTGGAMANVLSGGAGNDVLLGMAGNDTASGGQGDDVLRGGEGNDVLAGDAGNDSLEGESGDDVLYGGLGDDQLLGGGGADAYQFNVGDGVDSISDSNAPGEENRVVFGPGITSSSINLSTSFGQVLVLPGSTADALTIGASTGDVLGPRAVDRFEFADGTSLTYAELVSRGFNIEGTPLDDLVFGTNVDDRITGRAGNDRLEGGAGDDAYVFNVGDGVDSIVDSASPGAGNLIVFGPGISAAGLTLDVQPNEFNPSHQLLVVRTGVGGDALQLGGFDPDNVLGPHAVDRLQFADGSSLGYAQLVARGIDLTGTAEDDQLSGTSVTDRMIAGDGNDVLRSGSGDDTLDGGRGDDRLFGGQGDDTYVFGAGSGQDTILEFQGNQDTIRMASGISPSDVVVTRNIDDLILSVNGAADRLTVSSYFSAAPLHIERVVFADGTVWDHAVIEALIKPSIRGTDGSDVLVGTSGNDRLLGLGDDDQLTGLAGDDFLDGGTGADHLTGSLGNDTYIVDNAGDAVTESVNEGLDTVHSSLAYLLGANVENLALTGAATINGTGNDLDNVMVGNSGANVLAGGRGNDTYVVDESDTVLELTGEGTDTVQTGSSTTLGANLENLTLMGSSSRTGKGNALDNVLRADGSISVLAGGGGNDVYLNGDDDIVVEQANGGIDTVIASDDYRLPDHIENLTLMDARVPDFASFSDVFDLFQTQASFRQMIGIGNDLSNVLTGGRDSNRLDGGLGADTMTGGGGDDIYVVDNEADLVVELSQEGTDTVQASSNYVLPAQVENLTLIGSGSINGTGNAINNVILGNAAPNILDGGAGNDVLNGDEGADTFVFGLGSGQDTVADQTSTGDVDTIQMASGVTTSQVVVAQRGSDLVLNIAGTVDELVLANFYLFPEASFKQVRFADGTVWESATLQTLASPSGVTLSGGSSDEGLTGGIGNDSIAGNAGNDILQGGLGSDILFGDATSDSSLDPVIGNDTLLGGPGDDVLTDFQGTNVLDGGPGNDWLTLGAGQDTILFGRGSGSDNVQFDKNGAEVDVVQMAADLSPADVLLTRQYPDDNILQLTIRDTGETLRLNLSTNFPSVDPTSTQGRVVFANGTQWNLSWVPTDSNLGTASDDVLVASFPGTLTGLAGDDTYAIGSSGVPGTYTVVEAVDGGTDTVQSIGSHTLDANVERLYLLDSGSSVTNAERGTGNDLDNLIIGNTADNILHGGAGDDVLVGGLFRSAERRFIDETGSDILIGGAGDDMLMADGGNWVIPRDGVGGTAQFRENVPRLADDLFIGGPGNDTYLVHSQQQTIVEAAGEGTDLVRSTADYVLGENLENLTLENPQPSRPFAIAGTGNELDNVLIGNIAGNVLVGALGDDTLWGGQGLTALDEGIAAAAANDHLMGGAGDDTYLFHIGDGTDMVEDAALIGEGNRIQFGPGITASDLIFTEDQSARTLTIQVGTTGADKLILKNFDSTRANGSLVVETLAFANGSTAILAELIGGTVNHTPTVENPLADVTVSETEPFNVQVPANTFADKDPGDVLSYTAALASDEALPTWLNFDPATGTFTGTPDDAQVGRLDLRVTATDTGDLTASDVFTLIVTNVNEAPTVVNPLLDQAIQAGQLFSFTMPSTTFADPDVGDTLTYSAALANGNPLPAWLTFTGTTRTFSGTPGNSDAGLLDIKVTAMDGENLIVADAFNLTVTSADQTLLGTSGIDVLTGGIGNDELFGLTGNDMLNGGMGNDVLDGGPGADTMRGGQGNDTYLVDNASDVITENVNEGADAVRSTITYTLGANVEHLTLMGTAAINGTGNALDNVLIGNSGNNNLAGGAGNDRLDGGFGNDTMVGGAGHDIFVVDQAGDVVTEALNQGTDTVESRISYVLGSNLENLALTGTANLAGSGNSLNNSIIGNSGNNALDGGSGDDTMDGGAGDDTLQAGSGADTVFGGAGDDSLGAGSGNDVLDGGDGLDAVDGGSGNDILDGGAGNDTLSGGSGADQISGGTGNDTLTGGSGNDLYNFSRGDGQDALTDSDPFQGNQDKLLFGTAIDPLDLVISRQANDLRLAIHGTTDFLTVRNWYLSPTTNQIEVLQAGNGQHLLNTEVDQLIQAMASFSQQTGLTWDQAIDQQPQAVQTVLAASWH